jgi:glutamate/tyrosine decarboxylase-like PLP-dependent enzyme
MTAVLGPSIQITGLVATGDQSANQYRPVQPGSTAGTVKLATATTNKIIGILVNDPTTGKVADIVVQGVAKAKLANGVAAGDMLSANSTGNLKAVTAGRIVAMALEACSSSGNIHPVVVLPQRT